MRVRGLEFKANGFRRYGLVYRREGFRVYGLEGCVPRPQEKRNSPKP